MTKKLKDVAKKEMRNENENQVEEVEEVIDEALQALLVNFKPEKFSLGNSTYRLVKNYRDGFDYEAIIKRYNDILEKYDYIVGDWGYDQLRLKGFFEDDFKSSPIDAKISTLEDYLYEYCNFGCAYFVIQQIGDFKRRGRTTTPQKKTNNKSNKQEKKLDKTNKKKRNNKNKNQITKKNAVEEKKAMSETKHTTNQTKHQFTIRKKDKE